ncbi:MAG TPA: LamG domain-containing protein, partial [Armatimonadetes bacterium]|nr:LamG domain-containing protein [Armatimonadota bacterium]
MQFMLLRSLEVSSMRCGLKLAITLIVQLVIVMHQTQCYAIDGTGKASITPNRGLVAGMSYTFTITYTAGEPDAQVVNGRWNRAVRFTEPFSINYPSRAHLNISEGTIAFWVRPLWDADDGKTHRFFDCFGGRGRQRTRYHISKMSSGVLRFQIFTANRAYDLDFNIGKLWKRGEWHHVVATWRNIGEKHNDAEMHLYVDGHEVGKPIKMRKIPVRTIAPSFCIGAGMIGAREYADADIDELAIYDRAFAPNALPQGPPALEHPHLRFYAPFDGTVIPAKSELPIPRGIAPGGAIRIAIPRTWTPPQNRDPHGAGFVTATASPGTFVDITFGDYRNIEWYIIATIGGKPLTPGKWVRIVYGDRRYGAPGATIQPFPQRRWVNPRNHLGVWVDADGDGAFAELPPQNRYKLEIVAQPTAQFGVFAPSTVAVNEPFRVRVTAFDQFYND